MSELFAEVDRVIRRLDSDDPDFDDCVDAVALLERMRSEMAGPDGFPTWKDAAVHERQARIAAETRLAAAEAVLTHISEYWNRDQNETAMADALWHIIDAAEVAADAARGGE